MFIFCLKKEKMKKKIIPRICFWEEHFNILKDLEFIFFFSFNFGIFFFSPF